MDGEPVLREPYSITFEAHLVYDDVDCDIAYGVLRIGGITLPALRYCIHRPKHVFAVKVYGNYVKKVEKAPYFLQVPPHRYITFAEAPDVLFLLNIGRGALTLLCNLSAEECAKLRDMELDIQDEDDAWTLIKRIVEVHRSA